MSQKSDPKTGRIQETAARTDSQAQGGIIVMERHSTDPNQPEREKGKRKE
jgi:hypothetical protein